MRLRLRLGLEQKLRLKLSLELRQKQKVELEAEDILWGCFGGEMLASPQFFKFFETFFWALKHFYRLPAWALGFSPSPGWHVGRKMGWL